MSRRKEISSSTKNPGDHDAAVVGDSEIFIVKYKDQNYNLFKFLNLHPGGRSIIEKYENRDISRAFDDIGHSDFAKASLLTYLIKDGEISDETIKRKKHNLDSKFVISKLFTKEDKNYVHKTLGFLSLLSYVYRYCYVLPLTGTLGFVGSTLDYWTLFLHFILSFSSLIFHVVEKRIVSNPLIIYQEYRLHAIMFTLKAVLISVFGMNMHLFSSDFQARLYLGVLMIAIHLVVDYITAAYGTPGITTVRNNNDGSISNFKLFFSYYQVLALTSQLMIGDRLCDLGFNGLIAIQSSAFLMTLKRKSIIRANSHMFWYSVALFLSIIYIWLVKGTLFFVIVAGCFLLKNKFNINKYLMWFIFSIGAAYSEKYFRI